MRKKIISPGHRREMALAIVQSGLCSGRAVCTILHLARATYAYRGKPPSSREEQLIKRMRAISAAEPT